MNSTYKGRISDIVVLTLLVQQKNARTGLGHVRGATQALNRICKPAFTNYGLHCVVVTLWERAGHGKCVWQYLHLLHCAYSSAFGVNYTIDYLGDLTYELRLYIKIIMFLGKICLIENSGSDFLFKKFPDD